MGVEENFDRSLDPGWVRWLLNSRGPATCGFPAHMRPELVGVGVDDVDASRVLPNSAQPNLMQLAHDAGLEPRRVHGQSGDTLGA